MSNPTLCLSTEHFQTDQCRATKSRTHHRITFAGVFTVINIISASKIAPSMSTENSRFERRLTGSSAGSSRATFPLVLHFLTLAMVAERWGSWMGGCWEFQPLIRSLSQSTTVRLILGCFVARTAAVVVPARQISVQASSVHKAISSRRTYVSSADNADVTDR